MPAVFSHPGNWRACTTTPGSRSCVASHASAVADTASKSCARNGSVTSTTSTPGLGLEVVGHAGALRQRAQPGDGLRAFGHTEHAQREGQEEGHDVAPLAEPVKIGHDRVAVEQSQQRRVAERVHRLLPRRARRVALILRADLDEQAEPAAAMAGLVEEGLDRPLVVFLGQGANRGEGVDALGNVGDSH
jgi:hypothetical protein